MSGVHFVIAKNKNFEDIPIAEFYFDNFDNLIKALNKLFEFEFEINIFLDIDILTDEELESILKTNEKYKTVMLEKKEKIKYYKNKIEVLI
jgi:hypothetical protein